MLLFLQYGDEFAWSEIENVWTTLADSWPKNLKIILHFLISMSGVNSDPSLLPYVSQQGVCFMHHIFHFSVQCPPLPPHVSVYMSVHR